MNDPEIDQIESLIEQGKAYVVSTNIGSFVCVQYSNVFIHTKPLNYSILWNNTYNVDDFPIWAPYKDGKPSPWGLGYATLNLKLIVDS